MLSQEKSHWSRTGALFLSHFNLPLPSLSPGSVVILKRAAFISSLSIQFWREQNGSSPQEIVLFCFDLTGASYRIAMRAFPLSHLTLIQGESLHCPQKKKRQKQGASWKKITVGENNKHTEILERKVREQPFVNKIGALKSYHEHREHRKTPTCSGQGTCSEKIWEKTISFYPWLVFQITGRNSQSCKWPKC